MSTSQSRLLETRYVWGPTVAEAMELAQQLEWRGWIIQGNPSPMIWNGRYGTGVSVTRVAKND
jgi:hypothetical protein